MRPLVEVPTDSQRKTRRRFIIRGVVQGVGFRPFISRLARKYHLNGLVANAAHGARVEVEGTPTNLRHFQQALEVNPPPNAIISEISIYTIPCQGKEGFTICNSDKSGQKQSVIPPDLGTCRECLKEIFNPSSRYYRYPFTACTECGPRFSILEGLPYDRVNTTMKKFDLCCHCKEEYVDVGNRRFHAEATSCPACGPRLALWNQKGMVLSQAEEALSFSIHLIEKGMVLAVKGLGGFQLWVNASSDRAVQNLRDRKNRPRKPFAVLFPGLTSVEEHCCISSGEADLLCSPKAPIVLLRKKESSFLAEGVAPGNPYVGAMLPYTPLHHLMMNGLSYPVIATSGNRRDEPIVIHEDEALHRLNGIADAFLVHDRPIARPMDDSVVRMVDRQPRVLRRARGYVPTPISLNIPEAIKKSSASILALGGHLKNSLSLTAGTQLVMSQHIGDLSTTETCSQFEQTIADQVKFFETQPKVIACDLHPDYRSTTVAKALGSSWNVPVIDVQHHHAHVAACMAEHGLQGPVLGVAWDGLGYGADRNLWGGEFLITHFADFFRVVSLRSIPLPGGEAAIQNPCRVALSLLVNVFGEEALNLPLAPIQYLGPTRVRSIMEIIKKEVACPMTTSMGRLFDGVSSLLDLCQTASFEGEPAMAVEYLAEKAKDPEGLCYAIPLQKRLDDFWVADWGPLIRAMVSDLLGGKTTSEIAWAFHQALIELVMNVARKVGITSIILTGGVFQNGLLLGAVQTKLRKEGFRVYSHEKVPSNDGGLALGQTIVAAARRISERSVRS